METISQCLRKERTEFDDMWGIPKLYVSACSNSVQLVPLHPIIISILFHPYKELFECIREVEELKAATNNTKVKSTVENNKYSTTKEEEEENDDDAKELNSLEAWL
jgi:hypothetical protein